MKWFATAPSNIALIKYMGKSDSALNIPSNGSLSYTLPELESFVALEQSHLPADRWEPLDMPGSIQFTLSAAAQARFLAHFSFLKRQFNYEGNFIVRSCNNFPIASGLASSASSFAALTKAAVRALTELTGQPEPSLEAQAALSRQGSGSSCRSFFTPWALWQGENTHPIDLPYPHLIHHVVLVNKHEKTISSREAHERVKTSPLFASRPERAEKNLQQLQLAIRDQQWQQAYQIIWNDFMDMHQLFATATPAFSYRTEEGDAVLNDIAAHWDAHGDGPWVTMDAGPNIHLLFRPDQELLAKKMRFEFIRNFDVL